MEGDCQSPISWSRVVKGVGALGVLLRGFTQRRSAGIQAKKIDIQQPKQEERTGRKYDLVAVNRGIFRG
jgi:hypothetical protein